MIASKESIKLKEKQVKSLTDSILKSKTLIIASIKNLPSKQFQEIKKSIRKQASIKVAKKNIMIRAIKAIEASGKKSILELEEYIEADCAFIISDIEGFELTGILLKKKNPVFAKAGQIAIEDIEIKEGHTELVPGPVISELGSLGLQISVEGGKIAIKKSKVVIKQGQIINESAASLFQKLKIQPFNVGLDIKLIYDINKEKIYTNIDVNPKKASEELKIAASKALILARKINYYCKENIVYFLVKANSHEKALSKFVNDDR